MTDPGPALDPGLACPFVAFDDDRDSRSTRPDHRHRCYAEARPAPRAIAHQEAYCLSAGFARCPTFIDWARREAAKATPDGATVRSGIAGGTMPDPSRYLDGAPAGRTGSPAAEPPAAGAAAAGAAAAGAAAAGADEDVDRPRASNQRGWSAPPPWTPDQGRATAGGIDPPPATSGEGMPRVAATGPATAGAVAAMGATGSGGPVGAAGATGAGGSAAAGPPGPAAAADADAPSFLVHRASATPARPPTGVDLDDDLEAYERGAGSLDEDETAMRRFGPGTGRSRYTATPSAAARPRPPADPDAPPWERPRRFEAYPAIKTRRGMPGLSPILLGIGGIALAALILFFVPPLLLGLGGGGDAKATPTPTRTASASAADASTTPLPSPTPIVYVVKQGDTLSKIAKANGVTLDALIAANKAALPNPDKLKPGQQLVIPVTPPEEVPATSPSPSPSP